MLPKRHAQCRGVGGATHRCASSKKPLGSQLMCWRPRTCRRRLLRDSAWRRPNHQRQPDPCNPIPLHLPTRQGRHNCSQALRAAPRRIVLRMQQAQPGQPCAWASGPSERSPERLLHNSAVAHQAFCYVFRQIRVNLYRQRGRAHRPENPCAAHVGTDSVRCAPAYHPPRAASTFF